VVSGVNLRNESVVIDVIYSCADTVSEYKNYFLAKPLVTLLYLAILIYRLAIIPIPARY
jgi:hypothetical protein